jgi:methyl-accepting chemotaxis protein
MYRNLTIGRKLLASFGAVLTLVAGLLVVYLNAGRVSNERLRDVMQVQHRKLEIGAQVELATTEMQGAQRGLMLSYAMEDPAAATQYIQLYASSGKNIDASMAEMQPMLTNAQEIAATEDIRQSRVTWEPRFKALVELCKAGKIAEAYKLRNQNKVISAQMHSAATALVTRQKSALDRARKASEKDMAFSGWVAALIVGLSVALGGAVFMVVRGINATLRRVVNELYRSAQEVANASTQVSGSSQAVAQVATEQAASIQQTSASAEEINSMAGQNAGHSRAAHSVMAQTVAAIDDANRYFEEMQASMRHINESCEKAGKIVKVIDEIAFQTNILALNAAVESARAGEAGMGFAVVADEVRNLARRSADAARETSGLIEESISRSREGRVNLDRVAESVRNVTGGAKQVSALVEQVNSGSSEQARGVQQIAHAILEMDQATQSAAANAQETAAIGEEMSAQAETLNAVVRRLHVMVG